MAKPLSAPKEITTFAKRHGYELVRSFPYSRSALVFLAFKDRKYIVLKWPEEKYREADALRAWQGSVAPRCREVDGVLVLDYLSGHHPFYWSKKDLPKLEHMFRGMQANTPPNINEFPTLENHLHKIYKHLQASPLRWSAWGTECLQKAASMNTKKTLLHGDLHPWNIFLRNKSTLIDPYGLRGDPGYDLAFLAATLGNDQEDFLEQMVDTLDLPSARAWFPGLVVYRLDNSMRHGTMQSLRPLQKLYKQLTKDM